MKIRRTVFPAFCLFWFSLSADGQAADSSRYAAALSAAVSIHDQQLKDQLPVLNGSVFVEYPYTFTSGSPFFPPGHFRPGGVVYDDERFEDIPLVYDDLKDEVIAELTLNLRLVPEKIASFHIGDHRFVRLAGNHVTAPTGFYEILDSGKACLYKKQRKKLIVSRSQLGTEVFATVEEKVSYLISEKGRLTNIDNKDQLVAALKDGAAQVKKFIRDNRLELAPGNYEYGLLKVIAFYNQNNP